MIIRSIKKPFPLREPFINRRCLNPIIKNDVKPDPGPDPGIYPGPDTFVGLYFQAPLKDV